VVERPLTILQVNTADIGNGADRVAWNLFQAYREKGHRSSFAVGYKRSEDPDIFLLPNHPSLNPWTWFWARISLRLGHENFTFPGTWKLFDCLPHWPDIVHCHNLHGGYFDLRALAWISRRIPVALTLHDAWLLSGHCAHSFDCTRWKTGCGTCPDLTIYPSIRRDATAFNWRRKRDIFVKSRLYVSTPCRWLMQKVEQSMLAQAVAESRVIPCGVDLSIFHPADKKEARAGLRIPLDAKVVLFAASGIFRNPWKDYPTMRAAVAQVSESLKRGPVWFILVGEDAPQEQAGRATLKFVPFQRDPFVMARYYQAADIYFHAARAETFPNTIIEALACGTPVVATAVGGIPEQVKSLEEASEEEATGILVEPGDVGAAAYAIGRLFENDALSSRLGENSAKDAAKRFDLKQQADSYFEWYQEIVESCES